MRYVALEGIPGGGKTHLSEFLTTHIPESYALHEHVLPESHLIRFTADNPDREDAYRLNWTVKDTLVKLYDYKKLVITDRCFITTLAYTYSAGKVTDDMTTYDKTLQWCNEELAAGRLRRPDLCIVLSTPLEAVNNRKGRTEGPDMLWSQLEALKYAQDFYTNELPRLADFYKELRYIDSGKSLEEVEQEALHAII